MRPVGLVVLLGLAAVGCRRGPEGPPGPAATADGAAPGMAGPPTGAPPPPPLPDDLLPVADEPRPDAAAADTVRIRLQADPRRKARVTWGRKDLGLAPLEIVRPRGSGPLDLLVVAPGALPLHTRVFTDRDDTLTLRLYGEEEASALAGYQRPRD